MNNLKQRSRKGGDLVGGKEGRRRWSSRWLTLVTTELGITDHSSGGVETHQPSLGRLEILSFDKFDTGCWW